MNQHDSVLKMYSDSGIRSVEEWAMLGRKSPAESSRGWMRRIGGRCCRFIRAIRPNRARRQGESGLEIRACLMKSSRGQTKWISLACKERRRAVL